MKCLNKVMLMGYLGDTPEKSEKNGKVYTRFSLATNTHWTDKQSGEKREKTEWHRIVAFDALANIASDLLSKGDKAYVGGRIEQSSYIDKEGVERKSFQILADEVIALGNNKNSDEEQNDSDIKASNGN